MRGLGIPKLVTFTQSEGSLVGDCALKLGESDSTWGWLVSELNRTAGLQGGEGADGLEALKNCLVNLPHLAKLLISMKW